MVQKFNAVIWNSFILGVLSFVLEIVIAVPLGILAARKQYSRTDYAVTIFALIGISLPTFYFATILKYILSVKLGWLDLFGQVGRYYEQLDSWGKALDVAKHYIMPVITLTIVSVGGLMRYTRTNMLEVLNAGLHPHRACQGRFGKARHQLSRFPQHADPAGDQHRRLDPRPVLRCADYRDAVPDRGHRLDSYQAMIAGDIPFSMFYMTFSAILTLLGTLIADILYAVVDPRVRVA